MRLNRLFDWFVFLADRLKPAFVMITGDLINQMSRTNRHRRVSPHSASESGANTIRSVREAWPQPLTISAYPDCAVRVPKSGQSRIG
jgi:hypothetical protein